MAKNRGNTKLVLRGYKRYYTPTGTQRFRKYDKQGNIVDDISVRQFQSRAKRVEVIPKPPKKRETVREQRARWYANHVNKQVWENRYVEEEDYISFADVMRNPEFQYYEGLMHSHNAYDRDVAKEWFSELEEEFIAKDWGETP